MRQRLPAGEAGDEFDRLARDVNGMLAEIERLVEEVRGVGDAVVHDLPKGRRGQGSDGGEANHRAPFAKTCDGARRATQKE